MDPQTALRKAKVRIRAGVGWTLFWTIVIIYAESTVGRSDRGGPLFVLGLFFLIPGAMVLFLLGAKWARQADTGYAKRVAASISASWFFFFLGLSVIVSVRAPYWWVFLAEFLTVVLWVPVAMTLFRMTIGRQATAGPGVASAAPPPAAPAPPEAVLCPGCRATIPADAVFCGKCGMDLRPKAPPAQPPAPAGPRYCVSCGAAVAPGVRFCSGCGGRVG